MAFTDMGVYMDILVWLHINKIKLYEHSRSLSISFPFTAVDEILALQECHSLGDLSSHVNKLW